MKSFLGVIVAIFLLSGCVSRQAMLINPATNQTQTCSASGWGWLGAPYAIHQFNVCEENLRANGYKYPYETSVSHVEQDAEEKDD